MNENMFNNLMDESENKAFARTGGQKAAFVINLVIAALSLLPFGYYLVCIAEMINLMFINVAEGLEGIGIAVLLIVAIIALGAFLAFVLVGLIFFAATRKTPDARLKKSTKITFIYYIAASVLSIVAFIVVVYLGQNG